MKSALGLLVLFVCVSFCLGGGRRLMKPDTSFVDSSLTGDFWKVVAVYSQDNIGFYQNAKCLTFSFTDLYKPGFKPKQSNAYSSSSSAYYYDSSSNESSESDDSDDSSDVIGLIQNATWFNISTGNYESVFTNLDFGKWSADYTNSAVFFENNDHASDDEWIVSFSNDNFVLLGKKDASELFLLINTIDELQDTDDEELIEQAYHVFNASLLDTQNALWNVTYTPDCQVDSAPAKNFNFQDFASKIWYNQAVYYPLDYGEANYKLICGQMAVNNITKINNLTVIQLNISNYVPGAQKNQYTWTTFQYDYYEDPRMSGVFRPMQQGLPMDVVFDPNQAIVVYYVSEDQNTVFWAFQNTEWAWMMTTSPDLIGSTALNQVKGFIEGLHWESPYQDYIALNCNYGNPQ